MRIGIEMFGVQSPSRNRGIGRYTRQLVNQLLTDFPEHDWNLYFYAGLEGPSDAWPGAPTIRVVPRGSPDRDLFTSPSRLAAAAEDLDVLLMTCPFEHFDGYMPPARPARAPRLAAMLYDVIPALMPEKYLTAPAQSEHYYASLYRVRQYDLLLAISEATRTDGARWLDFDLDDMVNISAASDGAFFAPPQTPEPTAEESRRLTALGVTRPFFFCLTGTDERKNLAGLLAAYARLPAEVKTSHQLVITCQFRGGEKAYWTQIVSERGLAASVRLTDYLPDESVRLLYQRCAAFVFPSRYEGFGLPLLEAMHCGAAIVGGRNSSQEEVVGDAGLLAAVDDANDLAAKLTLAATDADLTRQLRLRSTARAAEFTWQKTAALAMDALRSLPFRQPRIAKPRRLARHRSRIAFFAPLPPARTGIAEYSRRLVESLSDLYTVDLFHDTGLFPRLGRESHAFSYYDYRLFPKFQQAVDYAGIVYQMGNSEFHAFVYDTLQRHPGLVVLHDLALADFHAWYANQQREPVDFLTEEIARESPSLSREYRQCHAAWQNEPGGLTAALGRRGLTLNRRLLAHAGGLAVHSPWAADRLRESQPDVADRLWVIPHGAEVRTVSSDERLAIRGKYNLAPEHLVFGCFGIVHASKYHVEVIDAFAHLLRAVGNARLLFVGEDMSDGAVRAAAIRAGVAELVRFVGHAPRETFLDLIAATDVGINLRRPPTHGETSGALLHLLSHSVPTLVTEVDAFACFPDEVVLKIPPLEGEPTGLRQALWKLAGRPSLRRALAEAAASYVQQSHDWSRVANLYAAAIEKTRERIKSLECARPARCA